MRLLALLGLALAACAFDPRGLAASHDAADDRDGGPIVVDAADDAAAVDAPVDAPIDAPVDAPIDAPIDARTCPTAPPTSGCTAFTCAGSTSCYYLCSNPTGWANANARCAGNGLGCLATIDDATEDVCIANVAQPTFPNLIWFGWFQSPAGSEPGGGWGWACGASGFVAGNWGNGEPNNQGGNEDCGAMGTGGGWIDGDCGTNLRYVCELP